MIETGGNIVATYQFGQTTVYINDKYIRTDPEELKKVLNGPYFKLIRIDDPEQNK